MRFQIYIIAILVGMLAWNATFDATRLAYHEALKADMIPNLHLRHHIRTII